MTIVLKRSIIFSIALFLFLALVFILADLELTSSTNGETQISSFYGYKDLIDEKEYGNNEEIGSNQAKFWGVPSF